MSSSISNSDDVKGVFPLPSTRLFSLNKQPTQKRKPIRTIMNSFFDSKYNFHDIARQNLREKAIERRDEKRRNRLDERRKILNKKFLEDLKSKKEELIPKIVNEECCQCRSSFELSNLTKIHDCSNDISKFLCLECLEQSAQFYLNNITISWRCDCEDRSELDITLLEKGFEDKKDFQTLLDRYAEKYIYSLKTIECKSCKLVSLNEDDNSTNRCPNPDCQELISNNNDNIDEDKEYIIETYGSCPNCNQSTERVDACMHITCPGCKTDYCYLCNTELDPNNAWLDLDGNKHFPDGIYDPCVSPNYNRLVLNPDDPEKFTDFQVSNEDVSNLNIDDNDEEYGDDYQPVIGIYDSSDNLFRCPHPRCNYSSIYENSLIQHMQARGHFDAWDYFDGHIFSCRRCNYQNMNKNRFINHLRNWNNHI